MQMEISGAVINAQGTPLAWCEKVSGIYIMYEFVFFPARSPAAKLEERVIWSGCLFTHPQSLCDLCVFVVFLKLFPDWRTFLPASSVRSRGSSQGSLPSRRRPRA